MSKHDSRYRPKRTPCFCKYCKEPFLSANSLAECCPKDACQSAKRSAYLQRRKARKQATAASDN